MVPSNKKVRDCWNKFSNQRHRLAGSIKKNKHLQSATEKIFTSGQKTHTD